MPNSDSEGPDQRERAFAIALGRLGPAVLGSLDALEGAMRRLHPPDFPMLRRQLAPVRDALRDAREDFDRVETPPQLAEFRAEWVAVAERVGSALDGLVDEPNPDEGPLRALRSMRDHAQAQARLYPLRHALPPVSRFFAESFREGDLTALEARDPAETGVGLFRGGAAGERGGFDLYVPEWLENIHLGEPDASAAAPPVDASAARPLIVALHGGSGCGEDFLWSWLREARSRGCILLAPTSRGSTWSLQAPEIDGLALRRMIEWVGARWRIDPERVLLTGLSDGATMTLSSGLAEGAPYSHLAPISGVLHPMNQASGNLARAAGRPIYLVHGALDWMFPVSLARAAAQTLEGAGADLVYREIEGLSHTYPREENARILEWFDPRLVPDAPATSSSGPSSSS